VEPVGRTLVIGGTGHVGAAICRQLRDAGHAVALTYFRNEEKARSLATELGAIASPLDLGVHESIGPAVQRADEELGGMNGLVIASGVATEHRTGTMPHVPKWDEAEPAAFSGMLSVNVTGAFFACQAAGRLMAKRKAGRIVLIGSIDGVKSVPSPVDYACCKAALVGMTHSLSKDLGPHGILVNLVAPGILDGGIANLLSKDLLAEYVKHCSLRRVGTADEVARWAVFLAGPRNTYLTGQTVILDGGL
jgi:3-oxoacyl-[acyl-carrier protein] reductase